MTISHVGVILSFIIVGFVFYTVFAWRILYIKNAKFSQVFFIFGCTLIAIGIIMYFALFCKYYL